MAHPLERWRLGRSASQHELGLPFLRRDLHLGDASALMRVEHITERHEATTEEGAVVVFQLEPLLPSGKAMHMMLLPAQNSLDGQPAFAFANAGITRSADWSFRVLHSLGLVSVRPCCEYFLAKPWPHWRCPQALPDRCLWTRHP